jgi:hypothetical protein
MPSPESTDPLYPLLNYFLPTVKLINKHWGGSKVRKVCDQPKSPYQWPMASPDLSAEVKAEILIRTAGFPRNSP